VPKRQPRHRLHQPRPRHLLGTLFVAMPLVVIVGVALVVSESYQREEVTSVAATNAPATTTVPATAPATADPTNTTVPTTTTAADKGNRKREQPPAKAVNPNCTLTVPANPLTAQGLATPYVLSGTRPGGQCHEAEGTQAAFVEATIVNPATGALSVYHPLVIDEGTRAAAPPVVPALPAGSVVGIWFGFNGDTITLRGRGNSLAQGKCVNGLPGSPFGQFAHCDAPAFFTAANAAIAAKRLVVPPLGTGQDGLPCPSVRDFGVVDQDQSDNVDTAYLVTADGRTAQSTAATTATLAGAIPLANGSDNRLVDDFVDPALGCTPFAAPDLTDNGKPASSLALDELQAAAHQSPPVALVPLNDPMTQVDGHQSVDKTNLYRAGVGQPAVNVATETPREYCTTMITIGGQRLETDRQLFQRAPSPDAAAATLFDFLTQRLQGSVELLGCAKP
jgi:hypothetical protein